MIDQADVDFVRSGQRLRIELDAFRGGIGNYVGRNYGRINSISETQLHIVEIVPSGSGGWMERPQTLTLQ